MKLLITGANGFVGSALVEHLQKQGVACVSATRETVGEIDANTNWATALSGVDVVVHTAGRAHVLKEYAADPMAEFRRVNVEGTANLARQAASAGVKRFIFISSVKANGEFSITPFKETDTPNPTEPYGISKLEAEQVLTAIGKRTGMEIVILRPPLVVGMKARGNIARLCTLIKFRLLIPLASVCNQRSFVSLQTLIDCITVCATHPQAANQVFFVADSKDISTPEFIRRLGAAMGVRPLLVPFPPAVLRMFVPHKMATQLLDSLQVDASKARQLTSS